jgi:hypothetical protein
MVKHFYSTTRELQVKHWIYVKVMTLGSILGNVQVTGTMNICIFIVIFTCELFQHV